jgi:L-rhamnose mutarotase
MNKYCLACDLTNDPELIAEYDRQHTAVWPEILKSITDSGITNMEIYRFGTRLFMIMETDDSFTFERKGAMDEANPKVQEWEQQMWKYQQAIPGSKPGEKWVFMDKIFQL